MDRSNHSIVVFPSFSYLNGPSNLNPSIMAEPSKIKAGDVVQLKSGGPEMTVEWVENNEAYCVWFTRGGEQKGQKFALTSINVIE
jgi:uncharacterized protein YodC (DUF2158 family)